VVQYSQDIVTVLWGELPAKDALDCCFADGTLRQRAYAYGALAGLGDGGVLRRIYDSGSIAGRTGKEAASRT